MFTAKDFNKELTKISKEKDEVVDAWLKDYVLPSFRYNGQGFICPEEVSVSECEDLLQKRGFSVKVYSQLAGSYIYITIPPQQE